MRIIFVFVLTVFFSLNNQAQTIELREVCGGKELNPNGKEFGSNPVRIVTASSLDEYQAGRDADHFYSVILETIGLSTKMYLKCNRIDNGEQVYVKHFKLKGREKSVQKLLTTVFTEGTLKVMWEEPKMRSNTVFVAEIDPKTETEEAIVPIEILESPNNATSYRYFPATSPDKNYYLVYANDWSSNKIDMRMCEFAVLDKNFKPVKTFKQAMPHTCRKSAFDAASIDNNGNVCFIYRIILNEKDEEYKYEYHFYDRASDKLIQTPLDLKVKTVMAINCGFNEKNNLLIAGAYSTASPKDFKRKRYGNLNGIFCLEISPASQTLVFNSQSPIDPLYTDAMANAEMMATLDPYINFYFDQGNTYLTCEEINIFSKFPFNQALVISKIGADGKFEWHKFISKSQVIFNTFNFDTYTVDPQNRTRGFVFFPLGDELVILYNDHIDNLTRPEPFTPKIIGRSYKYNEAEEYGIVVAATIKHDGSVTKQKISDDYFSSLSEDRLLLKTKDQIVFCGRGDCLYTSMSINK